MASLTSKEGFRATTVSTLCILSYLVSYLLRHLLAVYNPQMVASGLFTEAMTATLSSIYMISYAAGQLVCGAAGDYVHPRYMVSGGLAAAGGVLIVFSIAPVGVLSYILYGMLGLSLSMLRGPIVRLISESCRLSHARMANLFLSFAGFIGPLLAGLLVLSLTYRTAYLAVGCVSLCLAAVFFLLSLMLERRGWIRISPPARREKRQERVILYLIRRERLFAFLVLAAVVEITTSSVNHWLTLYMTEALSLTEGTAAMLYSALSFVRAAATFLSLPLFSLVDHREDRLLFLCYLLMGLGFLGMMLTNGVTVSLIFLFLTQILSGIATAVVWSIYLPSLTSCGRVSGVNGLMDAVGYFSAAMANLVFVPIASRFSYSGLLLAWCAACLIAVCATLFAKRKTTTEECESSDKAQPKKNKT